MQSKTGLRRRLRAASVFAVAVVAGAVVSPTALADSGLGAAVTGVVQPAHGATNNPLQTVQTAVPTAAAAASSVTEPTTHASVPAVDVAARTTQAAATTALDAAAPVTTTTRPILQSARPIVDEVLRTAGPVLEPLEPVVEDALATLPPPARPSVDAAPSQREQAPPADFTPSGSSPTPIEPAAVAGDPRVLPRVLPRAAEVAAPTTPASRAAPQMSGDPPTAAVRGFDAHVLTTLVLPDSEAYVVSRGEDALSPSRAREPGPVIPSSPLTLLASAAASTAGGALLLFAALAATLLLAAPELSRRLHLEPALRPPRLSHALLERPG